ncbi:MAG TPA: hypothetical protein VNZ86_17265, partial [Bacteroidia bacterium]|nr:hypothetical protein [Bacteroidia bacterium]
MKRCLVVLFLFCSASGWAQQDSLTVMTYNVLNYGDNCQGPPGQMHPLLRKIADFVQPDIVGLVKMQSIKTSAADMYGLSPLGFGDSILNYVLNVYTPGKYAWCPFTNNSAATTSDLLLYNTRKLGYLKTFTLCTQITDFDMYKLFYKDPNLSLHADTTFLYIVLNHTKSGTSSTVRDSQISSNLQELRHLFSHLPNLINMGDFNLHNSSEPGYQQMVGTADSNFCFFDPPFFPDRKLVYPIDWDTNPTLCPAYLTTSTRLSPSIPNSCGTGGGAKSWYDHIVLSPWIISGANYVKYRNNSYHTIGNDGNRTSRSVNDSSAGINSSAPDSIIEALYQFSNKYPVKLTLDLYSNIQGQSPPDPDLVA